MFPDEILIEILSRLPVESLLRFKCVSNSWLKLITSSIFIKSHLITSAQINPKIIFATYQDNYTIDYESDTSCCQPKPLDYPANDQPAVGCCNGLVCSSDRYNYMELWNPATKEMASVPYDDIDDDLLDGEHEIVMGFGYDPVAEQYKVVRSVFFYTDSQHTEPQQCEVKVCTLGTEEWRKIDDPPCWLRNRHSVPQVNGALHWLGRSVTDSKLMSDCNEIVSFDVGSEKFSMVPSADGSSEVDVTMGVLQGCLSMIVCQKGENPDKSMDVWLMKEYSVKESWSKLFSIGMPIFGVEFSTIEVLALRSNGEIVIKSGAQLFLYDHVNDSVIRHTICDLPEDCDTAHIYAESLVSIASLLNSEDNEA